MQLDIKRVKGENIDEELLCLICQNLLWKPIACSSCLNNFCGCCIQLWLQKKPTCPVCSNNYKEQRSPPILSNFLAKLKLTCVNLEIGCTTEIPYDFLEKHEKDCEFNQTHCKGCRSSFTKKNLAPHEASCGEITFFCNICQMSVKRKDKTIHNDTQCLQQRMRIMEMKCAELELTCEDLRAQKQKYMQNEQALKENLSKTQAKYEDMQIKQDETVYKNKTSSIAEKTLQGNFDKLKMKYDEIEMKNDDLKKQNAELVEVYKTLNNNYTSVTNENALLKETLQSMKLNAGAKKSEPHLFKSNPFISDPKSDPFGNQSQQRNSDPFGNQSQQRNIPSGGANNTNPKQKEKPKKQHPDDANPKAQCKQQ